MEVQESIFFQEMHRLRYFIAGSTLSHFLSLVKGYEDDFDSLSKEIPDHFEN